MKEAEKSKAVEGLRERKRRQTRERLISAALALFVKKGFDGVTVEGIATAADTTKRTFFDYFPSKEDVIEAWQDDFGITLAAAIRKRPMNEPLTVTVEKAFTDAISEAATPQSIAIHRLIRTTPSLRTREQLKYFRLEQMLADALMERVKDERGRFRASLLAMIMIGTLRLVSEGSPRKKRTNKELIADTQKNFQMLWSELREFAETSVSQD